MLHRVGDKLRLCRTLLLTMVGQFWLFRYGWLFPYCDVILLWLLVGVSDNLTFPLYLIKYSCLPYLELAFAYSINSIKLSRLYYLRFSISCCIRELLSVFSKSTLLFQYGVTSDLCQTTIDLMVRAGHISLRICHMCYGLFSTVI